MTLFAALLALAGPGIAQEEQRQVTFEPPRGYPAGATSQSEPVSVTDADLDDNGDADLAVANQLDASVSVFPNAGDGTFGAARNVAIGPPPGSTSRPRPMGVVHADFNRDGDEDLAVTSPASNGVFLLFGAGGPALEFSDAQFLAAGVRAFGISVEEINGDSRPDLAVTNLGPRGTGPADFGPDSVSIFLNNRGNEGADGTFARTDYPAGDSPSSVTGADLDGDNDTDLAVTNDRTTATTGDVSVYLNDGFGTLTPSGQYEAGDAPTAVADTDLDADGDPDLVVANLGTTSGTPDSVSVLLNGGDGAFAAPADYPAGDGPRAVTIADFDGDEDADFAVPYENERTAPVLSVYLNGGDGTFGPRQDSPGGSDSRGITSADFDDDGRPDLATPDRGPAQDALLVLLNATNRVPVAADDAYRAREDRALKVDPPGVLANDRDPDGDDLAATLVSGPQNGSLSLNRDGSFAYTPNRNFRGDDSFTYRADDGAGGGETATVAITVVPVDDDCTLRGTPGDDRLTGTARADVICGLGGSDTVDGGPGNDVLLGGEGRDVLRDDAGEDRLFGGAGGDRLNGSDGRPGDDLNGGRDTDSCFADGGDTAGGCP